MNSRDNNHSDLIGKKFKYDSHITGLSSWEGIVDNILPVIEMKIIDGVSMTKTHYFVRTKEGNAYEIEKVFIIS
jgi:hypothetical protein